MKTEQALQMIDQAISTLQVNRETHLKLQEAITVIRETLPKPEKKSK